MSNPHNPARYGELWPQYRIDAMLPVLDILRDHVVLSGGWAWHFMSPPGHPEYKHAHDHKDLDLMVPSKKVHLVMGLLLSNGFSKVATKYDRLPSPEDFRRYEKTEDDGRNPAFRLTIDFFVKDVESIQTPQGWHVVRPDVLLGYYQTIHSSSSCWAVLAAQQMLLAGKPEDIVGNPKLLQPPHEGKRK